MQPFMYLQVYMHQREMSSAVPQIRPFINDLNEKLENSSKCQNREIQNPILGREHQKHEYKIMEAILPLKNHFFMRWAAI